MKKTRVSLLGNLQPPPEPKMRNGPQVRLQYVYIVPKLLLHDLPPFQHNNQ